MTNLIPFKCLNCGSNLFEHLSYAWQCQACDQAYPVEKGIPILVRDWESHRDEIEQAKRLKPNWYSEKQPLEVASPWRHHLKKRRLYVESILEQYTTISNKQRPITGLDLGCGDGNHLELLQEYTDKLYASDYNLLRLLRAKRKQSGVTFFLADILDYPIENDSFEVIFFNHVLEHIPDDVKALDTVFQILAPNGLLVLGVPNEGAWWWQLAYWLQPQVREQTDHVHFYTADILTKKVVQCGFNLLEIKHLGWGPPHWGFDARIRKYEFVDNLFEILGKLFFPRQSSSLYIIAKK